MGSITCFTMSIHTPDQTQNGGNHESETQHHGTHQNGIADRINMLSAYIVIPLPFTPASLTAQTLVVNLIALLLTPRQAAFTMVVYILLGLTGLPVFSGAMGGPGKLFGPTGGYIMSWIPAVILMSWLKGKHYSFKRYCLVTILVGMPVIYLVGSAYMKFITGMDWAATFTAAVIPFIPLDIFKCLLPP